MQAKIYICILCGEITWETASIFIKESYEAFIKGEYNRILVSISSQGGDADAAWSIYTALKHLGCPIITVANGRVYSAGVIVYLTGNKRYVFEESLFLFHPTTVVSMANDEKTASRMEEEIMGQRIDQTLFKETLTNILTKAKKRDIMKLTHSHKSTFVDAKKALELGLATHIVENIVQIDLS